MLDEYKKITFTSCFLKFACIFNTSIYSLLYNISAVFLCSNNPLWYLLSHALAYSQTYVSVFTRHKTQSANIITQECEAILWVAMALPCIRSFATGDGNYPETTRTIKTLLWNIHVPLILMHWFMTTASFWTYMSMQNLLVVHRKQFHSGLKSA